MKTDKFHYFAEFTDEEKAIAVKYVAEAFRGFIEMTLDQKAEVMFEHLPVDPWEIYFAERDEYYDIKNDYINLGP